MSSEDDSRSRKETRAVPNGIAATLEQDGEALRDELENCMSKFRNDREKMHTQHTVHLERISSVVSEIRASLDVERSKRSALLSDLRSIVNGTINKHAHNETLYETRRQTAMSCFDKHVPTDANAQETPPPPGEGAADVEGMRMRDTVLALELTILSEQSALLQNAFYDFHDALVTAIGELNDEITLESSPPPSGAGAANGMG